ncbi:MAG: DUF2231 domain-containing protein [Desertimonas sp.]
MELESVFGLPAHPFLVHAAVVLMPIAVIALIVVAAVPRWRRWGAPVVLAATLISFGAILLARGSGEALEEGVDETELVEEHTEMGDQILPWTIGPVVLATGLVVLDRRGGAVRTASGTVTAVAVALSVVVGWVAVWKIAEVGHSGAKAVWSDVGNGGERDQGGDD